MCFQCRPYPVEQKKIVYGAVMSRFQDEKGILEGNLQKRKSLLKRFDIFRRCLRILLDENLCQMAVRADTITIDLTNILARAQNDNMADLHNLDLSETLERIQGLCGTGDQPKRLVEELQSLVKQGSNTSHDDTYYENEETAVEELIDSFMLRHAPHRDAQVGDYDHDFLVLLTQMEDLEPVSHDQQDQQA